MSFDLAKPFSDSLGRGASAVGLAKMPEMKYAYFKDKEITLDGWRMVGCRFDNCILSISSSHFAIEHCFVDSDTVVHWQGDAIKLVQLFNMRDEDIREAMPHFAATRNPDGSYTIEG